MEVGDLVSVKGAPNSPFGDTSSRKYVVVSNSDPAMLTLREVTADHARWKPFRVGRGKVDPDRLRDYLDTGYTLVEVLTVNQVANLLQISRQHVYTLISQGNIKGVRVLKQCRFSKRAIFAWIERRY